MLYFGRHLVLPSSTIRSVTGRDSATWPALDVIGVKPRRQFLGPGAPSLSLSLYLHVAQIPPRRTHTALRDLMASGEVFQLWTASAGYWGTFVIESVDHRILWTLPEGQVIAMAVEVGLVDPGEEQPAARRRPPGVRAYVGPTVTERPPEDLTRPPADVPLSEVARL